MNRMKPRLFSIAVAPLFVAGLVLPRLGVATDFQWDGGAGTGNWQTNSNWNPDTGNPNFNGTFSHRVNVNSAQELIHSASEGTTVYANGAGRGLVIGSGGLGSGTFRITGGSFSSAGSTAGDIIGNNANTAVMIIDGGAYTSGSFGLEMGVGSGPSSTLTLNSGSATITTLKMNNTNGTINLNGGTLTASTVTLTAGTNRINFNGGTYRLGAATAGFSTFASATVQSLGAIFDTNGFSATIGQSLLDGGGGGGLTKNGSGTLTLGAAAAYTGATAVNAGTLKFTGTAASTGFSIAPGAILEFDSTSATITNTANATFTGTGTLRKSGANSLVWSSGAANFQLGSGALIDVQGGTFTGGSTANEVWTSNLSDLNVAGGATFAGVEANVRVDAITGTGTIATGYSGAGYQRFTIGVDNGSSTFDGIVTNGSATGNLTKEGTGTITLTGVNTYTGSTTVNGGTLVLSGARTAASGTITVSNTAGTAAALNITAGTYALGGNSFSVGAAPTTAATGTVNQTGGAVTFTSGNALLIGNGSGSGATGIYNLSGGSITTFASGSRGIVVGTHNIATAVFNLSGTGVLNMTAASGGGGDAALMLGRYDFAGQNNQNVTFEQTGGTANVGILSIGGNGTTGTGHNSTLTLTGGTFSANQFARLAAGNSNTAEINIGGTADVTLPAFPTARGTTTTTTINFDGGTLRPLAASAAYMEGLTAAYVKAGGLKLDVATSKDITVSQALLTHGVSTGGGLTKNGVGALTLTGAANTYTGVTTINAGTLILSKAASTTAIAGNVMIGDGTSSDTLRVAASEQIANTSVISFTSGLSGNSAFLQLAGGVTETVGGITTTLAGRAPVIEVSSAGTGTLVVNDASNRTYDGILRNNSGTLALTKQGAGNLTLQNTGGVAATNFSGATTISGGTLTLNSTAGATGNKLVLNNWSSPITNNAALVFDNATGLAETFAQAVSGSGTLTKQGDGQVTMTANYTGGNVVVSDGTLVISTPGGDTFNPSTKSITVNSGGTVKYGASNKVQNQVVFTVNSGGTFDMSGYTDVIGSIAGAGTLTNSGALQSLILNLPSSQTFSGPITGALSLALQGGQTGGSPRSLTISNTGNSFTGNVSLNSSPSLATEDMTLVLGAAGVIPNTADLTINGSNAASGTGSYTGTLNLNGFSETVDALSGGAPTGTGTRYGTVTNGGASSATLTVGANNGTATFSGILQNGTGTLALTKSGTGVQTLSGSNTYSGLTTVSAGGLLVQNATALGTTASGTTVTSGAYLALQNGVTVTGESVTINGDGTDFWGALRSVGVGTAEWAGNVVVGSNLARIGTQTDASLIVSGVISGGAGLGLDVRKEYYSVGEITFTNANTYQGETRVVYGTLNIQNNSALGTTAGGTRVVGNTGGFGTLGLSNNITVTGETLTLEARQGASLNHAHLANLSGNNIWAGTIQTTFGGITYNIESRSGTLTLSGDLNNTQTGSRIWTFGGDAEGTVSGVIGGPQTGAQVTKKGAGTWTFSNANIYTGTTVIDQGTLRLSTNTAAGSGTLRLNGGRLTSDAAARSLANPILVTLDSALGSGTAGFDGSLLLSGDVSLQGSDAPRVLTVDSPVTLAGTITGSGLRGITKTGASTLTISGSGNWNGNTSVSAGTFLVTGSASVASGGNLAASGTGVFRINTSGQVNAPSTSASDSAEIRLEAGTLRTNTLALGGSGTFNWSGGTLAPYSGAVFGSGSDVSQPGGAEVYAGRTLVFTGDLTTGAGSALDLGDLYLSGPALYNQITISGTLSVGVDTTLRSVGSPYYLRPSTGGMPMDWGTLVLVDAAGGIVNPGNFDFIAPSSGGRSFSEFTGTWVSAGDPAQLDPDTWYVEYTANQVLFHYKVSAAIPEPASAGMLIAGGLLLRVLSRRRSC